jgi:ubiquinone/menaquinone biosynthesis C-methylase UbiE
VGGNDINEIHKGWQSKRVAENYEEKRFTTWSGRLSDWLDKVAVEKALRNTGSNDAILDLPCGTGRIFSHIHAKGYRYLTGADISDEMLRVARRKMAGVQEVSFAKANAGRTGFSDDAFKAILSIRFMGHLPREARLSVLREFGRICQGKIIVEYSQRSAVAGFAKALFRAFTVERRLGKAQWSWNTLTKEELDCEFQSAGLSVVRRIHKLPLLSDSVLVVARRSAGGS